MNQQAGDSARKNGLGDRQKGHQSARLTSSETGGSSQVYTFAARGLAQLGVGILTLHHNDGLFQTGATLNLACNTFRSLK